MRRSEHYREGARRRSQKAKGKRRTYTEAYRRREPFKEQARRKLNQAVKSGKIVKPDHCERCRQQFPRNRIQGHHPDYSKPLDVKWLCAVCHAREHWDYSVEDVA